MQPRRTHRKQAYESKGSTFIDGGPFPLGRETVSECLTRLTRIYSMAECSASCGG